MNKTPRVSIGMPLYNGERFLEEALDSILDQTFEGFELIISDNASNDRSQEICRAYALKDHRIRYFRNKENLGAAYNYNRVFKLSKGEYFKWAAHDDVIGKTFLERCVEVLTKYTSVVLCYPRTVIIDEHSRMLSNYDDALDLTADSPSKRFKKCLFKSNECNSVFGLFRSSALKKTNLIGNYNGSDYILLGEIAILGKGCQIPEDLFFRRDHSATSAHANPDPSGVAIWFDPSKKGKIVLPKWRRGYEFVACIMRADLDCTNRISCFVQMIWWIIRNRRSLWGQFQWAAKKILFTS